MCGYGEMTDSTGYSYKGYYNNDKKNGKGKEVLVTGEVYEGSWFKDLKHGEFKYTSESNKG